jgi:hypothetical protein
MFANVNAFMLMILITANALSQRRLSTMPLRAVHGSEALLLIIPTCMLTAMELTGLPILVPVLIDCFYTKVSLVSTIAVNDLKDMPPLAAWTAPLMGGHQTVVHNVIYGCASSARDYILLFVHILPMRLM